jgi:hypothetical protein
MGIENIDTSPDARRKYRATAMEWYDGMNSALYKFSTVWEWTEVDTMENEVSYDFWKKVHREVSNAIREVSLPSGEKYLNDLRALEKYVWLRFERAECIKILKSAVDRAHHFGFTNSDLKVYL